MKRKKDQLWRKGWDQEVSPPREELMKGPCWELDDGREAGAHEREQKR